MSTTIRTPSAAHLPTSGNVEPLPFSTFRNADANEVTTTFIYRIIFSLWFEARTIWSKIPSSSITSILLLPLGIALLVISCFVEQETSPTGIRLAIYLSCFWLVLVSLHIRKLMRTFRESGRHDSFIVTTAMLSFVFIKAFAILDGYSMVALIRVPPCLTLAIWIASHWCNSNVPPQIHFGA